MVEKKKTRSELKREAIIDGALNAFQQFGVADSSVDKIAELAQVSKRTVYNHFESKEVLVTEIITQECLKNNVFGQQDFDASKSIESQLTALLKQELTLLCSEHMIEMIRVAMAHLMFAPEEVRQKAQELFDQETPLRRWLKQAVEAKKLNIDDIDFAEQQIKGLLKVSAFWPQLMRHKKPLSKAKQNHLVEKTVAMFLQFYKA
ncbi:MAG: TetR/AcrR family transcriptional regulator [Gammaproteobacteria bacterium]|nr:TetR/AcrR family transcriptional regulator [Gammaproteobacteria bacterium]